MTVSPFGIAPCSHWSAHSSAARSGLVIGGPVGRILKRTEGVQMPLAGFLRPLGYPSALTLLSSAEAQMQTLAQSMPVRFTTLGKFRPFGFRKSIKQVILSAGKVAVR